ncbi:hypothetical protein [Nocardia aurea]|uniref:hypothetical protein n=1 Tax=Nocardia aurea TaxID=2144174 RepID=UPI0013001CC5|nr:hypothetical protein [Nocardia aurea]
MSAGEASTVGEGRASQDAGAWAAAPLAQQSSVDLAVVVPLVVVAVGVVLVALERRGAGAVKHVRYKIDDVEAWEDEHYAEQAAS